MFANEDFDLNLRKSVSVIPRVNKLIYPSEFFSQPNSIDDAEGILVNDPHLEIVGHSIFKPRDTEEELDF